MEPAGLVFARPVKVTLPLRGATVATVVTPHPSITLPAGILQAGNTYVFALSANAGTSPAAAARIASGPFRPGLDVATAGTVSGSFTP
ncbi:MAG: hypothetical protein ACJ79D_15480 [Myxococcales bacterium]